MTYQRLTRQAGALPASDVHWRIPLEAPMRAANEFGRLVARGEMSLEECDAALFAAGAGKAPAMDAKGRQAMLAHALRDAAAAWELARHRTVFAIRTDLAPLLARRAPSATLLAAARQVNDAMGEGLTVAEVEAQVDREIYWALRRAAPAARRRA